MLGVILNTLAVIAGSTIGILFKKGISEKISDRIMKGIGLCTIYIGISSALKGQNTLILIFSMVIGIAIGTSLNIDDRLNSLGDYFENKFSKNSKNGLLSKGFVTASLLFCVGSMTIVGSLNAGLTGDNSLLYTKSVLDFFSSIMLSVTFGFGVMLSAVFVLVFQGALVFVGTIIPAVDTVIINELVCTGSIIIMGIGFNIVGITNLKVANMLPAIAIAPLLAYFF